MWTEIGQTLASGNRRYNPCPEVPIQMAPSASATVESRRLHYRSWDGEMRDAPLLRSNRTRPPLVPIHSIPFAILHRSVDQVSHQGLRIPLRRATPSKRRPAASEKTRLGLTEGTQMCLLFPSCNNVVMRFSVRLSSSPGRVCDSG